MGFPPPQQPRKIDLQLESGEYFLSEAANAERRREEAARKKAARDRRRLAETEAKFTAPAEDRAQSKRRKQSEESVGDKGADDAQVDTAALLERVKSASKDKNKSRTTNNKSQTSKKKRKRD